MYAGIMLHQVITYLFDLVDLYARSVSCLVGAWGNYEKKTMENIGRLNNL